MEVTTDLVGFIGPLQVFLDAPVVATASVEPVVVFRGARFVIFDLFLEGLGQSLLTTNGY